jgi:hypothetical protein
MNLHPTPAERLLSMLEDEDGLDSRPAEDVRGDLAALGMDAAASVAFARALAGGDSPGGRLIGALMARDEDDEISRLENADIEEVRAQVDQGAAAAIAARARRRAGEDSNVVGLAEKRRRRRRLVVWGAPLAGIAASMLVFALLVGDAFVDRRKAEMPQAISAAKPEASRSSRDTSGGTAPERLAADDLGAAGNAMPNAESGARVKEKGLADTASPEVAESLALNAPAPAPQSLEKKSPAPAEESEQRRQRESFSTEPAGPPLPLPSGTAAVTAEQSAETDAAPGQRAGQAEGVESMLNTLPLEEEPAVEASPPVAATEPSSGLARNVEIAELDTVVVVDPSQVPLLVQSQAKADGELGQRLDEARRLAGDRPVIALYRIRSGDRLRDFAQIPLQPGLTQQLAAPPPLIGLLGLEAGRYDFLSLPPR